jgi:hypothetical protein
MCLLAVCVMLLLATPGCGDGRPDPRDNPNFDEAGYRDPSVGVQSLVDEAQEKP